MGTHRMKGYLTAAQVAKRTRLKVTTIYAYNSQRKMPPPVEKAGNSPLWREGDVDRWLRGQDPVYPRPGLGWRRGVKGGHGKR